MIDFQPALVYMPLAAADTRRRIERFMLDGSRGGYYFLDDAEETVADALQPPDCRPVLLRQHLLALCGLAKVFITDHRSTIGEGAWPAAIYSEMSGHGVRVFEGGEELPEASIGLMVVDSGVRNVNRCMEELRAGRNRLVRRLLELDPEIVQPSSDVARSVKHARERAVYLASVENAPLSRITERLQLEGYRNATGRVVWYPDNTRKLLAARG